jgi:hypothetical protein
MAWDTGLYDPEAIARNQKMADILRAKGVSESRPNAVNGLLMRDNPWGDIVSGVAGSYMTNQNEKALGDYNTAADNATLEALRNIPSATKEADVQLNGPYAPDVNGNVPFATRGQINKTPQELQNDTQQWMGQYGTVPGIKGKVLEKSLTNMLDMPTNLMELEAKAEANRVTADQTQAYKDLMLDKKLQSAERIAGNTDQTNQDRNKANFIATRTKQIVGTYDTTGHTPAELAQLQNAAVARAESEWNNSQGQLPSEQSVNPNVSMRMDTTDPNFEKDARAMIASGIPEQVAVGQAMLAQTVPVTMKGRMQGAPVIVAGANGQPVYSAPQAAVGQVAAAKPTASGTRSSFEEYSPEIQDTANLVASQYIAGRKDALVGIGRNKELLQATLMAVARQAKEQNLNAGDLMGNALAYTGMTREEQEVARRSAQINLAAIEANKFATVVRDKMTKVDPTQYPSANAIINGISRQTGDTNIKELDTAIQAFVNQYTRAITLSGTTTNDARKHAFDILNSNLTNGQMDAAIAVMEEEMRAALEAPHEARADITKRAKAAGTPKSALPKTTGSAGKQIVRTGTTKDGRKVIEYTDGTREYK